MILDTEKLHKDLLIKLRNIDETQSFLARKLGISLGVIRGLVHQENMKVNNLLKIVEWLETDVNDYIKK